MTKEQLIKEFKEKFPLVWNSRRREHVSIPDTILEKAFDFAFDAGRASGIEEGVKDMEHLVIWLAQLYQKNWNTFSPHKNPDAPSWKREAYMHFSTVQGMKLREKIEKIASQPFDHERVSRAIDSLTHFSSCENHTIYSESCVACQKSNELTTSSSKDN